MQGIDAERGIGPCGGRDERQRIFEPRHGAIRVELGEHGQCEGESGIAERGKSRAAARSVAIFDRADDETGTDPGAESENRDELFHVERRRDLKNADFENLETRLGEQAQDFALALGIADDHRIARHERVQAQPDRLEPGFGGGSDLAGGSGIEDRQGGKGDDFHVGYFTPQSRRTDSIQPRCGATSAAWVRSPQCRGPAPAAQSMTAITMSLVAANTGPPESPVQAPAPACAGSSAQSRIDDSGARASRRPTRSLPAEAAAPSCVTPKPAMRNREPTAIAVP